MKKYLTSKNKSLRTLKDRRAKDTTDSRKTQKIKKCFVKGTVHKSYKADTVNRTINSISITKTVLMNG